MKYHVPFELFIARRYLRSRRKTGFINTITYISIFGVAIGVAALIIVLSVMNGFESEVRDRILGFDAHIRLRTFHDQGVEDHQKIIEQIRDIPEIVGISPYILEKAMISHNKETSGIMVKGVHADSVIHAADLQKNIVYGELNLNQIELPDGRQRSGIVLGNYLADQLMADTSQIVVVISPKGIRSMFQQPEVEPFIVTGQFETGMFEYDNSYAYISIEAAQKLFRYGNRISGLEIRLKNIHKARHVADIINDRLGFPHIALTWFDLNKNLFSWIQLEKWAMFIILCLIILVAAFNIISTLIMMVMEKTREIGILKSMGTTSRSITRIFLYEGLVVGIMGTLLGELIGFGLCWAQKTYAFFSIPGDVYFINSLPILMVPTDFLWIGIVAILICLLAAVYPARRAASLDPVQAIRYE